MVSPYVISILVTSGDPDGVRVVEKSNWTGRGVMFARADLGPAQEHGLNSPGVYVLLGDDPDEEYDRQIYVGQADDIGKRLKQHQGDDNKDCWDTTIVFLSGNQSLNRAHISFLEAELIRLARSADQVRVANGNQPSVPHMPATDHAVATGFLDEMRAIFPVLGVDAFEAPAAKPVTAATTRFYLEGRSRRGEGEERSDGFLVFQGAHARLDETPSLAASGNRQRARLINSGRLRLDGDHYVLTEDTLFKTPSAAALVLTGPPDRPRRRCVRPRRLTVTRSGPVHGNHADRFHRPPIRSAHSALARLRPNRSARTRLRRSSESRRRSTA